MRAKQRPGWKRQVGTLVSTKRGVNRFPVQGWEIETAPLPRVTSLAAGLALLPSGEPQLLKGRHPRVPRGALTSRHELQEERLLRAVPMPQLPHDVALPDGGGRGGTAGGAGSRHGRPVPGRGAQLSPEPSTGAGLPGDSLTSGRRRRRGIPGRYQVHSWGTPGRPKAGAAAAKTSTSKERVSVSGGSSFPGACGRVRGGASGSRSLTSPRLDRSQLLRMLFAFASEAGRAETLSPRGCTGTGTKHKSNRRDCLKEPHCRPRVTFEWGL